MVKNEPKFREIYQEIIDFIGDSKIAAHNAAFDINMLNYELSLLN